MDMLNCLQGFFQRNSRDYERLLRRIDEQIQGADLSSFQGMAFLTKTKKKSATYQDTSVVCGAGI